MAPKASLLILFASFLIATTAVTPIQYAPPHIPEDSLIHLSPVHPPIKSPVLPPIIYHRPPKPPIHPPVKPPVIPPIKPPVHPPVKPPTHPPVKPPVKPPIHPPINPPIHSPVKPPVHPPVKPPIHPPSHPPTRPPVHPPVKPPSPSPSGYVALCFKRCQHHAEHRRCMRLCGACYKKYKCVPYETSQKKDNKCKKWDKVKYHGKEEKCP